MSGATESLDVHTLIEAVREVKLREAEMNAAQAAANAAVRRVIKLVGGETERAAMEIAERRIGEMLTAVDWKEIE